MSTTAGKSLYSSYERQLLAALYEEIGDDEASLKADVIRAPEGWRTYIQELRTANRNLPAMQDEFKHL